MIQPRIRQNPFETYEEVAEGFEDLLAPLELFFDREYQGHLDLGTHGTVYSKGTRGGIFTTIMGTRSLCNAK